MGFEVNGTFPNSYFPFIEETINKVHGTSWTGLKIIEVGDEDNSYDHTYFTTKGAEYTIYQPVGKDGNPLMGRRIKPWVAKRFNIPSQFDDIKGQVDVIINVGTVEHLPKQYVVWNILHDMLKVGGVAIHIMPDSHECQMYLRNYGHCHNYFNTEFFETWCSNLSYEIVNNELLNWNRSVGVKKLADQSFSISTDDFESNIKHY